MGVCRYGAPLSIQLKGQPQDVTTENCQKLVMKFVMKLQKPHKHYVLRVSVTGSNPVTPMPIYRPQTLINTGFVVFYFFFMTKFVTNVNSGLQAIVVTKFVMKFVMKMFPI